MVSSPPVLPLKSHRLSPLLSDRVQKYESGEVGAMGRDECERDDGMRTRRFDGHFERKEQGLVEEQGQDQEQGETEKVGSSTYTACGGIYTVNDNNANNTAASSPSSTVADSPLHPVGVPASRPWSFVEGASDEVSVAELPSNTHEDRESQMAVQYEYANQRMAEEQRACITQQEMDEARSYWSSAMAQMNEAVDHVLGDDQNNSTYSLSNLERTTITHPFSAVVADVFYKDVCTLNRERQERALCIDDPDALLVEMFISMKDEEAKEKEIPWPEMLTRQLPSPGVFTPCTYRSKHHTVSQVARASACLAVGLQDYALKARALQYNENRMVLEEAFSESEQRSVSPSTYSFGTGVMTPGGRESQYEEGDSLCATNLEEDVQLNLIAQWELKRDIERLVALQRNVKEARSRLTEYPLLSNYSIRQSKIQRTPHLERSATPTMDSESNILLMETMMRSGTHVERTKSVDWAGSDVPNSSVTSLRSLNSQSYIPDMETPHPSNRQPHPSNRKPLRPYGRQSLPVTRRQSQSGPGTISPRPSSVYNAGSTVRSETPTQCPPSVRLRLASIEEDRLRIAAENIVRSLGSVSIRTQRSVSSPIAESLRHESVRTEERREQERRSVVVFPRGLRYGEQCGERYPSRQNID
ncbi:hypothetical protein PtrSN001A_002673 [Pyrenophora tritici-repentis]|uniref:ProP, Permease of the major facilitator superfamily n=1 Tax=Pyrenophora tritici-repentis TaxID=45151 RepID=A0A922NS33_9PLEO|nr:hypothetical protein Ptr86124_000860 [Pyrenophora tritici-repentis]KAI1544477.1 hypothetical protein PtrSN001A_002673 [Pyrenophora tritici-repentis]PZC92444.1 hypothetical protein A1F95_08027 [Pyrenophora tritici-repentis]